VPRVLPWAWQVGDNHTHGNAADYRRCKFLVRRGRRLISLSLLTFTALLHWRNTLPRRAVVREMRRNTVLV
jgi:hypothetical protein